MCIAIHQSTKIPHMQINVLVIALIQAMGLGAVRKSGYPVADKIAEIIWNTAVQQVCVLRVYRRYLVDHFSLGAVFSEPVLAAFISD